MATSLISDNLKENDNDIDLGMSAAPSTTDMNSLLDDVTAKIFTILTVEERQKIRGVCSKWKKIVDEGFGMKIRIKNSTSDLIMNCPFAVDVELASMTIPFESGISFAQSVRTLRFTSIVVTYNLSNFLQSCSGITMLSFTNVVIDQPVGDEWSERFWRTENVSLPYLERIEIKCYNFAEGISDITRLLHDRVQFGNLKEICILAQNPPSLPLEILFAEHPDMTGAHCILQLIWKNQGSLKKFQIGRKNHPIILKFLERSKFREPTIQLEQHEYVAAIQIEEFIVHPYFREDWAPVLKTQFNLKMVDIGSVNVSRWEDIRQCIVRNALTLENFTIGGLSFGQIWDCSIFETCHALHTLNIMISHSHKLNLHLIPQQLQHLHLFGPVSKDEIISIADSLKNLTTLKFSHLGRIEIVGAPDVEIVEIGTPIVKSLLKLPKLTMLAFIVCSSVSIDWENITQWCRGSFAGHDVILEEHFYQMHGENCRNGLTLKIAASFDRENFDWEKEFNAEPVTPNTTSSMDEVDVGTDGGIERRIVHFNLSTFSLP